MASTRLAMKALGVAITNAINAATDLGVIATPTQVYIGNPTSTKLADIMHEGSTQAMVSLFALKGKNTTRSSPISYPLEQPTVGTTASISTDGTTLTIGGTPKAGDVIHAFFAIPAQDAAYLVTSNDTVDTIATQLAAAANALGVPGATASASGAQVILTGAVFSKVNLGGTGTLVREVARLERPVQATVWCNDPDARLDLAGVIIAAVGTAAQPFLTADDGTAVRCEIQDDPMDDKAQSSYSTFKQDLFFKLEYGITQTITGTQVGGTQYQQTVNSEPTQTAYYG